METLPYHDFRGFIEEAKKISEWRLIEGADWDGEIGALIESTAELDSRPMLLFDKIKSYPAGFRLVSLAFANYKRTALAFGISPEKSKLEVVRLLARKLVRAGRLRVRIEDKGPIVAFHEGVGWVAQIGLFILLGLLVFPSALDEVALEGLALSAVLILVSQNARKAGLLK